MSLKDAWLGDFVARSDGETLDVVVVATLFFVSTVLPTAVTVVLLGQVSRTALDLVKEESERSATSADSALGDSSSEDSTVGDPTHEHASKAAV